MSEKYTVEFEKNFRKTIQKIDKHQARLILGWISKNLVDCENPYVHGKGLTGNHSGKWRYRIGDYRLVVNVEDEKLVILALAIGHRKDIYTSGKW